MRHLHRGEQSHTPQEKQTNQNTNCLWVIAEMFIESFPSSALLPGRQHHRKNSYHWHPLLPPNKTQSLPNSTAKALSSQPCTGVVWALPEEGWISSLGHACALGNCSQRGMGISSVWWAGETALILYSLLSARSHSSLPAAHSFLVFTKRMRQWDVAAQ